MQSIYVNSRDRNLMTFIPKKFIARREERHGEVPRKQTTAKCKFNAGV
jgi:hypothetical protein